MPLEKIWEQADTYCPDVVFRHYEATDIHLNLIDHVVAKRPLSSKALAYLAVVVRREATNRRLKDNCDCFLHVWGDMRRCELLDDFGSPGVKHVGDGHTV